MPDINYKIHDIENDTDPQWKKYAKLTVGTTDFFQLLKFETITFLCQGLSGALGLITRRKLYPFLFLGQCKNLTIGKNVTFRHPHKIKFGSNVIIDDNCVIDAKGQSNEGITIGNNVFIGRNSIIYTKNGDIIIGDSVNIGANCTLYSKNKLLVNNDTMIAGYCYIMSGGQYDYMDPDPFAAKSSFSRGPTEIGENCWLGARVTVMDNTKIGKGSVIGAGSVITSDIPSSVIAFGVPAKIVKGRFEKQTGKNLC